MRLYPVDEQLFLQRFGESQVFLPVRFTEFRDGRPQFIFSGHRLTPRVS
jgi:hypothetical protein